MLQVVTDSSCDLPGELIVKHGLRVVPLAVSVGDEVFLEGVDITPQTFYTKMAQTMKLPTTSQPAPAAFAENFRELADLGPVICLTISSKLSGTYQSACLGRELSGVEATIFDTLSGSLGHGLQVLRACELARAGCTVKEAEEELDRYRNEMKTLVLLNTLENIVKGGRLSRFQGSLAKILDIKVLLHAVEGEVVILEKVRGQKKFIHRVVETIYESCPDLSSRDVGITHFNNPVDVETIQNSLEKTCHPRSFLTNYMGPTMATYAGEGGMIVAY